MAKFRNMDFDLCGSMTDKEFRDVLGQVSAFCIYEDATGIHNAGVKASSSALSGKSPIAIIAIGANVTDLSSFVKNKTTLTKIYGESWDLSGVTAYTDTFAGCTALTDIRLTADSILASVNFEDCPLSFSSVVVVLNALTGTPSGTLSCTFKSGLYAGFTADQKAVIDALVTAKEALGWDIANMGA